MKTTVIIILMFVVALIVQPSPTPKITRSPSIAEFNELKARVDLLEEWATRHGGKFK